MTVEPWAPEEMMREVERTSPERRSIFALVAPTIAAMVHTHAVPRSAPGWQRDARDRARRGLPRKCPPYLSIHEADWLAEYDRTKEIPR